MNNSINNSMNVDFTQAEHTVIVSDLHLSDGEPGHPLNPLWKRFKRPKHFIDRTFKLFLETMQAKTGGPIELVLNGDIFDFDSVMKIPKGIPATWLERHRGLASEEAKSRFKMKVILQDHLVWVEAIRHFILKGNHVVFVIGNHDMELHWLSVREEILEFLELPEGARDQVRFCEWFYLSNNDTLIEHGNQYDAYCMAMNPIHPLIKKGFKVYMRLPFGNMAGKYMLNGMGLMNPHVDSSFIKSTFKDYFIFYYRYVMRTQPFLLWTWFWSAFVTLTYSLIDGFLPSMRDPMTVPARVSDIAARSNATPDMVWALRELHVHPAIFNPLKIMRELWLDRALLLVLIVLVSFQFFSTLNVFINVSLWWFIIPVSLLIPVFISYAQTVESELDKTQNTSLAMAPLSARIARVKRVVHGHLHRERHSFIDGVEYLNPGTWSPAFRDVECTQPFGRKCFVWLRKDPAINPDSRVAGLFEWKETDVGPVMEAIPIEADQGQP